ncbi:MAG TPA: uroporphyrinogen-III synthase [Kofleriaceae bacterium]|jgi:uroporphyrinogen-III synthase
MEIRKQPVSRCAVITRADSIEYAEALAPLGYELLEMPVTRPEAVAHRLDGGYEIIAVASARAAAATRQAIYGCSTPPEVWAVGAATQRALAELRVTAHVPAGVVDGESLAAAILAQHSVAGVRVLVPRAEGGRPELADKLRSAGAIVDDAIVYRTVATTADDPSVATARQKLLDGKVSLIVVLAPSQVRALVGIVGPLPHVVDLDKILPTFCAIGETTAAALRDEGVTPIVAPTPTPAGIAMALAAVYPHRT